MNWSATMQVYQEKFIQHCLKYDVLRFGEFTLKSGRVSPYFFNAGLFKTGLSLALLGNYYAQAIIDASLKFNVLFGPAYKGIPLVSAAAIAFAEHHNLEVSYAFNRKETKDHGEGGMIIGEKLRGDVLIIDDVITAGTAIRESITIITAAGAKPAGVVLALDRQEKGLNKLSAIQEVELHYKVPVISIIKLEHLLQYVSNEPKYEKYLSSLKSYREQYGA